MEVSIEDAYEGPYPFPGFAPLNRRTRTARPVATLKCIGNDGTTLTLPAYAYTWGLQGSFPNHFTVYTNPSQYEALILEQFFGQGYARCSFSSAPNIIPGTVAIQDVTSSGVSAGLVPTYHGVFNIVTFSYSNLTIGGSLATPKSTLSPKDAAKALSDFQARGLAIPVK